MIRLDKTLSGLGNPLLSIKVRLWMAATDVLIALMQTPYARIHRVLFWHGKSLSEHPDNPATAIAAIKGPLSSRISSLPALEGSLPDARGTSPVVYAGCDPVYLERFGHLLARSLAATSLKPRLHLHVMAELDGNIDALIGRVRRNFTKGELTVTVERRDFEQWPRTERLLYYRSTRIVRLQEIVERTGQPVVLIDIDNIFLAPLEQILKPVAGYDVAMPMRLWRREPWMRVMAGFVYVSATPRGRQYLKKAAEDILDGLHYQQRDGYFDQWRMYLALSEVPGLRYRSFPARVVMVRDANRSTVLSGRGNWKDRHHEIVGRLFDDTDAGSGTGGDPS